MKSLKSLPFILILGLIMGFGVLVSAKAVSAQDNKPKTTEKQKSRDADDADEDDDDADESSTQQMKLAGEAKINKERAMEIALERVPGEVIESEIEKEDGKLIWSFDIRDSNETIYDVEVDAMTGLVLQAVKDDYEKEEQVDADESTGQQLKLAAQAKISKEQATGIALKRVPGKVLDSEIEKENGKLIWSFDIRNADGKIFDVEIDAMTGKVLQAEEEHDEDGDDDGDGRMSSITSAFNSTISGFENAAAMFFGFVFGK